MKKILVVSGDPEYIESWLNLFTQHEFANVKITPLTNEQLGELNDALTAADESYRTSGKFASDDEERDEIQTMRDVLSEIQSLLLDPEPRVVNPPSTNATNYMED